MIKISVQISDYHRDYFVKPLEELGYRGEILCLISGYSVSLYHDEFERVDTFCDNIFGLEKELENVRKRNEL